MQVAKGRLSFKRKPDRRGPFKTVATGLSYGGGQMVRSIYGICVCDLANSGQMPGILSHSKCNQQAIRELLANPYVKRVIGYGNSECAVIFSHVVNHFC